MVKSWYGHQSRNPSWTWGDHKHPITSRNHSADLL
jgi:hypothetical protein